MSDEDDIFSRWSRRKRQVAKETEAPVATVDATAEQPPEVTAEEDEDEAAILEKFNLPVPETMQKGDDFSGFMQAGVPEFLRKRALRVLWRSNPVLANLDGLNDYDDDFNAPELTQKVLATAYQVGRGFARNVAEVLEPDEKEETPEETNVPDDVDVAENNSSDLEAPQSEPTPESDDDETDFRPRRMRFET